MTRNRLICLAGVAALGAAALVVTGFALNRPAEDRRADADDLVRAYERLGEPPGGLSVEYPLDGTVFPPELPPPEFRWRCRRQDVQRWIVRVAFSDGGAEMRFETRRRRWRPDAEDWRSFKRRSRRRRARWTLIGVDGDGRILAAGGAGFRTADEPVGAPILYRSVPLPFLDAVKHPERIRWRLLNVARSGPPRVVLENLPVCGNCHSSDASGRVLGMDVDYANDKGSYALVELSEQTALSRRSLITWSDFRRADGEPTFGLLSRVSPDGRYVLSTVKDRSVFVPRPTLAYSQLFFPVKGILAWYDRQTGRFGALDGANDPRYVQSNAAWSPDGAWVYFCRAEAPELDEQPGRRDVLLTPHLAREYVSGRRGFQFNIYRVPFADGAGGEPELVEGAGDNGQSNYFPRISPDGRWMVFCRAENFMLLQPDSELWIVPADGGRARRMTCNTGRMNSWHAWSPNGRWLVFATKFRGPHTQLCLTYVNEDGRDSPPVLLEAARRRDRACNIPEFLNIEPDAKLTLSAEFLNADNYCRQGQVLLLSGEPTEAIALFEKALALDADHHDARLRLAAAWDQEGRPERALRELEELLRRLDAEETPDTERLHEAHSHAAMLSRAAGRRGKAIDHYRRAIEHDPGDVEIRILLALTHASAGELGDAEQVLARAVRARPDHALAHMWLGQVRLDQGRRAEAVASFRRAMALRPERREDWLLVARRAAAAPDLADEARAFLEACPAPNTDGPPHDGSP